MVVSRDRGGGGGFMPPSDHGSPPTAVTPSSWTPAPRLSFYFHSRPSHLLGRKRHISWKQTLCLEGFAWRSYVLSDLKRNWFRNSENTKERWIKPFQMGLNYRPSEPLLGLPFVLLSPPVRTPAASLSSAHWAWRPPVPLPGLSFPLSSQGHPTLLI